MSQILGVFDSSDQLREVSDNNGYPVKITGSTLQEQKTEADSVSGVVTFSVPIQTIEIYNTDATNSGSFVVNGITIKVPAGKVFKASIGGTPNAQVTVSGATTYIVSRYT